MCVAPDYILVPRDQQDALVSAFTKTFRAFWPHPRGPLDDESELANINKPANCGRLQNLISDTEGTIVLGGNSNEKRIAPTVVKDVNTDDILMQECVQIIFVPGPSTHNCKERFSAPLCPSSLWTMSTMLFA